MEFQRPNEGLRGEFVYFGMARELHKPCKSCRELRWILWRSMALGGVCADYGTDLLLLFVICCSCLFFTLFSCAQPSTALERNLARGHSLGEASLSAHLACGAG